MFLMNDYILLHASIFLKDSNYTFPFDFLNMYQPTVFANYLQFAICKSDDIIVNIHFLNLN